MKPSPAAPYVTPELPEDAPTWTRTWCSERTLIPRRWHEETVGLARMVRTLGRFDAWRSLSMSHPMHALCRLNERASLATLIQGEIRPVRPAMHTPAQGFAFCVVMGIAVPREGLEPYIAICDAPVGCKTPKPDHWLVRPADLTVLGYRLGVTPQVMRAMIDGKPWNMVRDMARHPERYVQ